MARTSNAKKIKDRQREVEFESIDDEIKRDRVIGKAAGTRRTFTRAIAQRAK